MMAFRLVCARLFAVLILGWGSQALALITITTDEVWNGINNPHAAEGVTLVDGVYTIPTGIAIGAGVNVYLNDPFDTGDDPTGNVTWEFLPGAGGLTFTDADSTIDVYNGGRNNPQKVFALNMNDNPIGVAAAGAGRIINGVYVLAGMTGDAMTVNINSQANVVLGTIDITVNDAQNNGVNVTSRGLVDINRIANSDVSTGGGGVPGVNVTAETLILGDFDTRSFRDVGGLNGNINLRALGQPENSVGDFNANTAAVNTITLDGLVNTNPPPAGKGGGNLILNAVKVTLASTFMTDLDELADFTVNTGQVQAGFTANQLFVNNSSVTPDFLNFSVFHDGLGPAELEWDNNGSGNWFTEGNWTPTAIPSSTNTIAVFGSFITSQQTVFLNQQALAKGLRFNTAAKVALSGTSGVTLESASGNASISVLQGSHEIQVPLTLMDTTDVSASAGTQLDINGVVNLNSNTLNVTGAGQVNVNNQVTGGGSINSSGVLGTGGSTGVTGNLTSTGTLDIDIAGTAANFFDAFSVTGTATLSGLLSVDVADSVSLSGGEIFEVVSANSVSAAGLSLAGPDAGLFNLLVDSNSVTLQAIGGSAVPGDYNGDGTVNAADYTVWRDTRNSTTNPAADGDGSGTVNTADYNYWKARFGNSGSGSGSNLSSGAVPEPGSVVLALVAGLALVGVRRRQG